MRDGRDPQIVIGRGIDHNFVLDAGKTSEPKLAARLEDPRSGRVLEVLSDQPGIQVYTGNFLDGTLIGKQKHVYRMGDGIALEPQVFPDTPNQPAFGSARVDPGQAVPSPNDLPAVRCGGCRIGSGTRPMTDTPPPKLRSRAWFDNPDNVDMTALYLERYTNYGISLEELQSGKPIIGIAQTGSDLMPCNRHHLVLASM